eukprot:Phypoly_transcript_20383.p1 GENE.Phypoly_transcript_20383~~Phypoly_transcript_20383.p1  ORF type:complete len:171 (+),score=19.56 Phypoly_transcript_20383:103-615(+)
MLEALQAAKKERAHDNGFSWVLDNKLGGMRLPQVESELAAIVTKYNIRLVVSLTEQPIQCLTNLYEELAIVQFYHSPISDFSVPSIAQAHEIVSEMDQTISAGHAVVVHCHAGMGRTGMILACYLTAKGNMSAQHAVDLVRKKRPGSIVRVQENFIVNEFGPSLSKALPN